MRKGGDDVIGRREGTLAERKEDDMREGYGAAWYGASLVWRSLY